VDKFVLAGKHVGRLNTYFGSLYKGQESAENKSMREGETLTRSARFREKAISVKEIA